MEVRDAPPEENQIQQFENGSENGHQIPNDDPEVNNVSQNGEDPQINSTESENEHQIPYDDPDVYNVSQNEEDPQVSIVSVSTYSTDTEYEHQIPNGNPEVNNVSQSEEDPQVSTVSTNSTENIEGQVVSIPTTSTDVDEEFDAESYVDDADDEETIEEEEALEQLYDSQEELKLLQEDLDTPVYNLVRGRRNTPTPQCMGRPPTPTPDLATETSTAEEQPEGELSKFYNRIKNLNSPVRDESDDEEFKPTWVLAVNKDARVGESFQVSEDQLPPCRNESCEEEEKVSADCMWCPDNELSEEEIVKFLADASKLTDGQGGREAEGDEVFLFILRRCNYNTEEALAELKKEIGDKTKMEILRNLLKDGEEPKDEDDDPAAGGEPSGDGKADHLQA